MPRYAQPVPAPPGKKSASPPAAAQPQPQQTGPQRGALWHAIQRKAAQSAAPPVPGAAGQSGLPGGLKAGIENLSGLAMDDVRVHRNSAEPAKLGALAYTKGRDIHLGPGQERHLPHEAWHVVQQKQGRVKPTLQMKGTRINDDAALEREADAMGARAMRPSSGAQPVARGAGAGAGSDVVQRAVGFEFQLRHWHFHRQLNKGEMQKAKDNAHPGYDREKPDRGVRIREGKGWHLESDGGDPEFILEPVDEKDEKSLNARMGEVITFAQEIQNYKTLKDAVATPMRGLFILPKDKAREKVVTADAQATLGIRFERLAEVMTLLSDEKTTAHKLLTQNKALPSYTREGDLPGRAVAKVSKLLEKSFPDAKEDSGAASNVNVAKPTAKAAAAKGLKFNAESRKDITGILALLVTYLVRGGRRQGLDKDMPLLSKSKLDTAIQASPLAAWIKDKDTAEQLKQIVINAAGRKASDPPQREPDSNSNVAAAAAANPKPGGITVVIPYRPTQPTIPIASAVSGPGSSSLPDSAKPKPMPAASDKATMGNKSTDGDSKSVAPKTPAAPNAAIVDNDRKMVSVKTHESATPTEAAPSKTSSVPVPAVTIKSGSEGDKSAAPKTPDIANATIVDKGGDDKIVVIKTQGSTTSTEAVESTKLSVPVPAATTKSGSEGDKNAAPKTPDAGTAAIVEKGEDDKIVIVKPRDSAASPITADKPATPSAATVKPKPSDVTGAATIVTAVRAEGANKDMKTELRVQDEFVYTPEKTKEGKRPPSNIALYKLPPKPKDSGPTIGDWLDDLFANRGDRLAYDSRKKEQFADASMGPFNKVEKVGPDKAAAPILEMRRINNNMVYTTWTKFALDIQSWIARVNDRDTPSDKLDYQLPDENKKGVKK